MHRTRVKVCCISSREEASKAIAAGADALGLVGPMPSGPGVISIKQSADIAASTGPSVARFFLSSQNTAEGLAAEARRGGAETVQIVRHIAPTELERLSRLDPSLRRVQVIHVEDGTALDLIDAYAPFAQAFLLDSGRPGAETAELGGTGRAHDWSISAEFVRRSPLPVFLAGGLTPDNVADAIRTVRPFGLDLCSGIRTSGRLDPDLLARFMRAVRETDQDLS
ncbi:phosphoribosylanthranilate isomerase [Hyphobacterium sp.]|jgi:phosphoribosylanthranilate isomerase|uniref:phosphoribosylanthranilate isomerase n=1 Tax=Hyphobacterium sp. TaxID=2004662 RepID=UPI003BA8F96A